MEPGNMATVPLVEESKTGKETNREQENEPDGEEKSWSWGAGTDGQLGTGKLRDEFLPQLLHLPSLSSAGSISMLSCGGAHVVALTSGGKVLTWGRGTSGQLGHGEMSSSLNPNPVKPLEGTFITHVSAGWSHSGFVSDAGCVFICGDGTFGQLGHGDYRSHCSPVKVKYFANKYVQQIACGMRHSLVLLSGGQVYGFGAGKRGQLGISINKIKSINLPQPTCGIEHVNMVAIRANGDRSAALSVDRQLYIWGKKFDGASDVQCPQLIPSSFCITEAALGWNHVLVMSDDREVFMLGGSHHGVLSDLDKTKPPKNLSDSGEPTLEKVPGLDGVKVLQIAAGAEHSALVTDDDMVKTWGWGEHGQLGLGTTHDQTNPQKVDLGHECQDKDTTFRVYCGSGFTYAIRSCSSSNET